MSRKKRILGVCVLLAVGAFPFYLVAANVLIGTPMLRALINKGPDQTTVEYGYAYTLWPGRVRVWDLRIRDRDNTTEWMLALDEGRASISLFDLFRKRFHPTRICGNGLILRVRSRLDPNKAQSNRPSFAPPIFGFPDPPIRGVEIQTPPDHRGWTVQLDGVIVDSVREIWVDDYHYTGDATLTGAMFLRPKLLLEVSPTSLEVRSGELRLRGEPMAAHLRARLDAVVHPCDLRKVRGDVILQYFTGTGQVKGTIEHIRFLNEILNTEPRIRLQGGKGRVSAHLTLDRGLGNGGLESSVKGAEAVMTDASLKGDAEARMDMTGLDLGKGVAGFEGSRLDLRNVLVKLGHEEPWNWWGHLNLTSGSLDTDAPRVFSSRVEVRAQDARPLYRLFNTKMPWWTEELMKMKDLTAQADVTMAPSFLEVKSLQAAGGAFHILGHYRLKSGSGEGAFLIEAGPFSLGVGVAGGQTQLKLTRAQHWYKEQIPAHRRK